MRVLKAILPLVMLAVGAYAANRFIETRPTAPRSPAAVQSTPVEVVVAATTSRRATVTAMGTVVAAQSLTLYPEVTGRLVEQSAQLVPGGRFRTGDVIARIEPRDYELDVEQAEASVEQAQFELEVERGRQVIARREWSLIDPQVADQAPSQDLALRKPHLRNAEANLAAARSRLELAKIRLDRTTILAPFNALVDEEFVDIGQLVTPQTRLATLVGTDEFWVRVTLPVDRLRFIAVPKTFGPGGAPARVIHTPGPDARIERDGRVLGLQGGLDPVGRMAQLLVGVQDPLALDSDDCPPLLLGAYVTVDIQGAALDDVCILPRAALREGDRVWTVDGRDRLEVRRVTTAWRDEETIWISQGVAAGDRVIVSRLATPVPGLLVHVQDASGTDAVSDAGPPPTPPAR